MLSGLHHKDRNGAGERNRTVVSALARPRQRCDSVHPLHFCPCGVVQTTCLPLMQEITGAKPVRDTRFHLRFTNCDLRFWWPCASTSVHCSSRSERLLWAPDLQDLGSP